ncbi:MAG: Rne/Rng family ribonuclease [Pseudomonadota bacterium]|nr:Rne/Rng family ribonuclease [Pseudomonadota bacterium]
MSKRMLIDGAHPEEIRVVVTSGNRLDEYDIETTFKKQVKGNIYLAKVTRVEPSLQAAFVDFGGNRHGFLAFSEIHPDYYQIPTEDRQALLDEQEELERKARAAREHLEDLDDDVEVPDLEDVEENNDDRENADTEEEDASAAEGSDDESQGEEESGPPAETAETGGDDDAPEDSDHAAENNEVDAETETEGEDADGDKDPGPVASDPEVEEALEAAESAAPRRTRSMRRYKIQEVIKRRQILLVQVVKEERGNKGAALTTYISLAGRYCVLMPNSSRGGGISRKITGSKERRKLRDTLNSLDIPQGMGVIIRTAGLERNKAEIKRDFEYLIRAWDEVRETTLQSTAPDMVYEEGDIIKRAIRDVYSKDIDEIQVEGPDTYHTAKRFMRLMMPSHAKRVQQYRDEAIPLYQRFQIEQQLDAMHNPEVQLKSGGYIVINPTEALVAIDVNSGKSTRERNIEETALKTNLEAAEEVARQLRLRDLAGLIVIDFIDMEDGRNVRKVERRLKDAMKTDRARLQIGHISNFGLLELSRQRLRPSLLETSSQVCPHCRGTGNVLSMESMAMRVLRAIEEEGIRMRTSEITVRVPTEVALYILNQKRSTLVSLEKRYGFQVILEGDDTVVPPDIDIDRVKGKPEPAANIQAAKTANVSKIAEDDDATKEESSDQEEKSGRSRRRRGRRRGQNTKKPAETEENETASEDDDGKEPEDEVAADSEEGAEKPARRRRRGRRGGRRRNRAASENEAQNQTEETSEPSKELAEEGTARKFSNAHAEEDRQEAIPEETNDNTPAAEPDNKPENSEPETNGQDTNENGSAEELSPVSGDPEGVDTDDPKRRGWWQRIVD